MRCPHVKPRFGWVRCPICGERLVYVSITSHFKLPDGKNIYVLENRGKVTLEQWFFENCIVIPDNILPGHKGMIFVEKGAPNIFGEILDLPECREIKKIKLSIPPVIEAYLPTDKSINIASTEDIPLNFDLPRELAEFTQLEAFGNNISANNMETSFVISNPPLSEVITVKLKIGLWELPIKINIEKDFIRFSGKRHFIIPEDASYYINGPIVFQIEVSPAVENSSKLNNVKNKKVRVINRIPWLEVKPSEFYFRRTILSLNINTNKIDNNYRNIIWLGFESDGKKQIFPLTFDWVKREKASFISVDLGTSNTCVCVSFYDEKNDKCPVSIPLISGDSKHRKGEILSAIKFVDFNNEIYELGQHLGILEDKYINDYLKIAKNFKSLLNNNYKLTYFDDSNNIRKLTPTDITKIFIIKILGHILGRFPIKPKESILGCSYPAGFTNGVRNKLIQIWQEISKNFTLESAIPILPEPVALFIAYLQKFPEILPDEGLFAVFDFGGYTADISFIGLENEDSENIGLGNKKIVVFHSSEVLYNNMPMGGELLTFELSKRLLSFINRSNIPYPKNIDEPSQWTFEEFRNYAQLISVAEEYKTSLIKGTVTRELVDASGKVETFSWNMSDEKIRRELESILINFARQGVNQLYKKLIYISKIIKKSSDFSGSYPSLSGKIKYFIENRKIDALVLGGNSMRNQIIRKEFKKNNFTKNCIYDAEVIKLGVSSGISYSLKTAFNLSIDMNFCPVKIGIASLGGLIPIIDMGEYIPKAKIVRNLSWPIMNNKIRIFLSQREDNRLDKSGVVTRIIKTSKKSGKLNIDLKVYPKDEHIGNYLIKKLILDIIDSETGKLIYREEL